MQVWCIKLFTVNLYDINISNSFLFLALCLMPYATDSQLVSSRDNWLTQKDVSNRLTDQVGAAGDIHLCPYVEREPFCTEVLDVSLKLYSCVHFA